MTSDLGHWEPMAPLEVTDLLRTATHPWWIAGGWALDLHLGRQTRLHDDTDVLILRDDQLAMQEALGGWDLHAADPPGSLRPWRPGEILPAAVHGVWCRRTPASPWSLQVMIDDAEGGIWTYRRDTRIRRPVAELDHPRSSRTARCAAGADGSRASAGLVGSARKMRRAWCAISSALFW